MLQLICTALLLNSVIFGSNECYHKYDHSFDMKCSSTCIERHCESITGRCTLECKLGYYGDKCNKQCSSECQNFACNREKGSCNIDKVDIMTSTLKRVGSVLLIVSIVCLVFAIIVTVISTVKSITQRRGAVLNEGSEDYAENEYEPTCRNTTDSDHMYAIPEETASGSVPLGYLENTVTLPSNDSTEDMNMFINPVYADTQTSNEY